METINFMYWLHNYTERVDVMLEKVYGKDLGQHFFDKFKSYTNLNGTHSLMRLFMNMSEDNKVKLLTYVNSNYQYNKI